MTPPPALTSRDLNVAAFATRALLDALLVDEDIGFETSLILGMAAAPGGTTSAAVLERFTLDARLPATGVPGHLAAARAAGLVTGDEVIVTTPAGQAIQDRLTAQTSEVVARVYAGVDHDDLVVARRVVDQVTAQARAELARRAA